MMASVAHSSTEIASGAQNPLSKVKVGLCGAFIKRKAGLVSLLDFGNVRGPCELLLLKDLETLLNGEQPGNDADLKCYSLCFNIYKNISALENHLNNDDLLQAAKTSYELREQFVDLETYGHGIEHITEPLYEYFSENEACLKNGIDQIARNLFQVERSFGPGSFDLRVPRDIQIHVCGKRVQVQSKQVGSILMEYRLNDVFEDVIKMMVDIALKPLVKRQIVIEKVMKGGPFLCCIEFRKPSDNFKVAELLDSVVKFAQAMSESLFSSAEVKSQFGKEIRPVIEELLMKECFYDEVPESFSSDDFEAYRQTLMKPFFEFERQIASYGWVGQNYASSLSDQVVDIFFEKRKDFIKDAVEIVLNNGDQNLVRFDPASLCTENEKSGKGKPTGGKGKNGGLKETQVIMKPCRIISSTSLIMDMVQEQILLGLDYFNHPNKSLSYRFFLLARLVVDHWVAFLLKGKMDCFRSNLMNKCAVYTDSMHGVYRLAKIDAMIVKTGKFPLNNDGNPVASVFADLYPFVLRQGELSLEQGIAETIKRIQDAFGDDNIAFAPEHVLQICEESYKTFKYMLSDEDSSRSMVLLIEKSASLLVDRHKHASSSQEKLQLKFFMINFKTRWIDELIKLSSSLNDLNVNELVPSLASIEF